MGDVIPFKKRPKEIPKEVPLLDLDFDTLGGWPPRDMLSVGKYEEPLLTVQLSDDEELVLLPCDTED